MNNSKILIFIPTYNEKDNVDVIIKLIRKKYSHLDLLFIDDNSPDGTGDILQKISNKNSNIFVIHRKNHIKGIGSAHIDGIKYAYNNNYDFILTMDCDLSHSPDYFEDFFKNATNADLVIGTRFQLTNSIENWNLYRKSLTNLGHIASKIFLGLPFDTTGAFRLYNLQTIDKKFLDLINFYRYSFFFESLFIISKNKYKIVEIPITLPSRVYGNSKQRFSDIAVGIKNLLSICYSRFFNKKKYIIK